MCLGAHDRSKSNRGDRAEIGQVSRRASSFGVRFPRAVGSRIEPMNFAAAVLPLLPKGGEGRGEEALYAAVHGKVFGAHSGGEPLRSLPTPKSCITYSICPICRPLVYRNVARVMQKVNHMSRSES